MKTLKNLALLLVCVGALACTTSAQTTKLYQNMTASERATFVSAKAKEIARRISNSEYQFTASFETEIQTALDAYAQRLSKNAGGTNLRVVIERGQSQAPKIMSAFTARDVSPLMGLYIPWIESEYVNGSLSQAGAIGIFQFMPKTGKHLGLTPEELLDVEKSADAAARYLSASLKNFESDKMKEALALLAYNRGDRNVEEELARRTSGTDNSCSICVLTEQRKNQNRNAKVEDLDYLPRFFGAAILGENPQAFGLTSPPLSSFGTGQ
jgi:soluble lytic murein transglycosylase-like protein